MLLFVFTHFTANVAVLPRIRRYPQVPKDSVLDEPLTSTIQATGPKSLNYQRKPAEDGGSKEWQPYDLEGPDSGTSTSLPIASLQMSNKESCHYVMNNVAGTTRFGTANLIGKGQYIYILPVPLNLQSVCSMCWCVSSHPQDINICKPLFSPPKSTEQRLSVTSGSGS